MAARLPGLPDVEVDPAGLESLAVAQRTDLGSARAEVEAAAHRLGLTRATALFPEGSLTLHNEHEPEGTNTIGPGIEVPIPLWNQGQPAIAASQARLRQSQRRYAALAVAVRTEVRRARNRVFAARDRAQYFGRVVVPLQHQIVQQTQLEYNAMLVGIFNLLQAKRDEIEAGREYVEAIKDYWVARAELERAVGGRLTAAAATTQPATPLPEATTRPAAASEGHQQHQHQGHGGQQ
jgi:cobalt-zinc-cadmium efflux system outer membrane protein